MFGTTLSVKFNIIQFQKVLAKKAGISTVDVVDKIKSIKIPTKNAKFQDYVDTVSAIKRAVEAVVLLIEGLKSLKLTSEQKKDLGIDLLDALIEVPWLLTTVERTAYGILISFVVDEINKSYGKIWDTEIIKEILAR